MNTISSNAKRFLPIAHDKMVCHAYLSMEIQANMIRNPPREYAIQDNIEEFFQGWLKNTRYRVASEKEGRFDIVVYDNADIVMLYEIKTFYKDNEKIDGPLIIKDAKKLFSKKISHSKKCRKFIVIAGRKGKLKNKNLPDFIQENLDIGNRSYYSNDKFPFKLRPSRKRLDANGRTFFMTWEVI